MGIGNTSGRALGVADHMSQLLEKVTAQNAFSLRSMATEHGVERAEIASGLAHA